jgi:hypothetical protein
MLMRRKYNENTGENPFTTIEKIKDIFSGVLTDIVIPHTFQEVLIPLTEEKTFRVVGIWENFLDIVDEEEKPIESMQIPEKFDGEIQQEFLKSLNNGNNLYICLYRAMGLQVMTSFEVK